MGFPSLERFSSSWKHVQFEIVPLNTWQTRKFNYIWHKQSLSIPSYDAPFFLSQYDRWIWKKLREGANLYKFCDLWLGPFFTFSLSLSECRRHFLLFTGCEWRRNKERNKGQLFAALSLYTDWAIEREILENSAIDTNKLSSDSTIICCKNGVALMVNVWAGV